MKTEFSVNKTYCHFVKFVIGDAIKFDLLEIHINVAESKAALNILQLSSDD